MRCRIVIFVLFACSVAGTAYAAPLRDFSPGHAAVDYTWYGHQVALSKGDRTPDHTPYDWAITVGLDGSNAVQYRETKFDNDRNPSRDYMRNRELNLIHRFDRRVAAFAGVTRIKGTSGYVPEHQAIQCGIIGDRQLTDRMHLYGILSGSKHNEYANVEFGLGYALSPQTEINLVYRHLSADHLPPHDGSSNLRGFGLGMTYKF